MDFRRVVGVPQLIWDRPPAASSAHAARRASSPRESFESGLNAKLKPYLIQAVSHTGTLVAASAPDRLSVLEKTPESARGENQHVPPGRAAHRRTHALLRVSFVNRRRPERCALSADRPGRPHERSRAWRDVRLGDQQE